MAVRGRNPRPLREPSKYNEPSLFKGVDDILKTAEEKGFYTGKSLNIADVIEDMDDVVVKYEEMDAACSGCLKYNKGQWVISVNRNHHKNRQNFTLAHELGHYVLHKEKNTEFRDTTFFRNDEISAIEYAANEFAGKLLMPENKIRACTDAGEKSISNLAREFSVSTAAMKNRLSSLGYKFK